MEKLRECPHCGSTNIGISPYDGAKSVVCMGCLCMTAAYRGDNARENAIAAWNRRAEPENEALTLDQLRQMDGEPVWIHWIGRLSDREDRWAIVHMIHPQGTLWDLGDYGKTWLAYAHRKDS